MSFNLSDFMASVPMDPTADPTKPKKGQPMQQPVAQPAPPVDPVAHYLNTYKQPAESTQTDPVQHYLNTYKPQPPGFMDRVWQQIGGALSGLVHHPESVVTVPFNSFANAVAPTSGGVADYENDPLEQKIANDPRFTDEEKRQHIAILQRNKASQEAAGDATGTPTSMAQQRNIARFGAELHPEPVTPAEKKAGVIQTAANVALPVAARFGLPAILAGGAAAGAAYNPNDPVAGAATGFALAGMGKAAGYAVGKAADVAVDLHGRPMQTTPITVGGVPLMSVEGISDRAAKRNAQAIGKVALVDGLDPLTSKPAAAMDVAGTAGVRLARGLKTSSPAAESVIRGALEGRADDAVARVIQHGLEKTGLVNRESGIQLTNDLVNARSDEANAAFPPVFQKYQGAIADPRIAQLMGTDAGPRAWRDVPKLMRNRFLAAPDASAPTFDPSTLDPKKAVMYERLVKLNGGDVGAANQAMAALGETPNAPINDVPAMNLQQLHYWAKSLDNLAESGSNRGPGSPGNAYGDAKAVQGLARMVRQVAKENVPEYGDLTQKYAEDSDLIRGSDLGNALFKMHPDETAIELQKLPVAAQDVFRRAGFDALSQRIQNGPENVERSVGKSLDRQRMQMLFPDQPSFDAFRQGLSDEAQMHVNKMGVLSGSNTADKLADIADMAGVTLPDVMRAAATGRWHRLMGQVAANTTGRLLRSGADAVHVEQARQLMAGANGDIPARITALRQLGLLPPAPPGLYSATQAIQDAAARLPAQASAGNWAFGGDAQHGPAMPVPQPLPQSRRLGPGFRTTPVAGDMQQGTAMPIRQPLPLSKRLPSGGPTPIATAGESPLGPAIPTAGQTFEATVQHAVLQLYRKNPEWAVTLTREQQAQLEAQVRAQLMGGR